MKTKAHFVDSYLLSPVHPITVNLIGVGGTGSHCLTQLARIHYALKALDHAGLFVHVIDDDVVENHNIGRQMFYPSDVGQKKAQVLVTRINRAFNTDWQSTSARVDDGFQGEVANVTISCVDSLLARQNINRWLTNRKKHPGAEYKALYWLDTGNEDHTGQVVLGSLNETTQPESEKFETVKELPTLFERYPQLLKEHVKEKAAISCSMAESLLKQDLLINSMLAQYAAQVIWTMLKAGYVTNAGAYLNLRNLESKAIHL